MKKRGKRILKRVLIGVTAIFALIVVGVVILLATVNWNRAKPYIAAGVSKATGRELKINGDLEVDLGWIPRLRASQIQFQNASWGEQPQMAEIGHLDVQVDLWQLLSKFRLVLPTVTIAEPKVLLEKNKEGNANWEFRASTVAQPVPQKRTEVPVVEKLIIKDGSLLFKNRESNTQIDLKLSQAEVDGFLGAPLKLKIQGAYQKLPLTLTLDGGSYDELKDSANPYPLRIDLGVGKLKAKLDGNLIEPLEL